MKLSKSTLYTGIIGYSAALFLLQDWPLEASVTGTMAAVILGKILFDVLMAGMAGIRLFGDSLFADDEEEIDGEAAITTDDLHFSDTALFGLFFLDLMGDGGWHAYQTVMTTGAESSYFMIWTIVEAAALFITSILWKHAAKSAKRAARKAREATAAKAALISSKAA